MSTKPNDGGPAFPMFLSGEFMNVGGQKDPEGITRMMYGMSLRDWFAGMALQGYLSDPDIILVGVNTRSDLASLMYSVADAMIAEKAKRDAPH